ncbi:MULTISPECIES: response regulator [Streptomyces]|uniref:LuxR family transcriptional regulator n=1 Tax=Streptomyces fradiae ATCC 10745 = DSM 40063 TaxID=1319510 RepID=A0A1Y2NNG7_STRFR|nr:MULTISPECIES: response regulator transcription factor [Streptomyces]KAF0649369.1 LuxR family transcriptional regulator [Streptomyces fradiae ATCC 10745 = DSM 40063]OSY49016.1 Oxygen regulatory protein NreC [Streptomyces fradiae ATCC 10745 = DSM 40063]QEV14479.1 DNA-binding response regulator [Streptomyces fradiae ATCC 10745 = DSM 40063]
MRVLIVEDDALLRAGLELLLATEGITVVGAVDRADRVPELVRSLTPDVVVMDVRLPPTYRDEGLRAAAGLRRERPGFPVLVLSAHVEDDYATELLGDDASGIGYLLKDRVGDVAEFTAAVRRVRSGGTVMDPEVISQLLGRRRSQDPIDQLTPREREVLGLMAEGHDNGRICELLNLSVPAVSKHIKNIFTKLGLPPSGSGHRRVLAVLAFLNR